MGNVIGDAPSGVADGPRPDSPAGTAGDLASAASSDATGDSHWPDYYAVTVDRPAWGTTMDAADRFAAEDADLGHTRPQADPRLAVDLGCGAGRDTRELLRRGWRVLAVDREATAIEAVTAATPEADRDRLEGVVAELATFELPPCDLVVASVSLQLLSPADYAGVFERLTAALRPGGRFAGLLYGDRDEAAGDPDCTCPSPDAIRDYLRAFEIESWHEREEDGHMALGAPHHIHLIEVVARRRPA
ncbi:MAG TPA: class I SAM-dependent methyltransferase [Candidatus Limnocylindrales bacterium]